MNLEAVEIPRNEARQSYLDYRRQAQIERDPVARHELEEIAAAFRIAASEELALIALAPTITRGGTVTRTQVVNRGRDNERRTHYALPRLAAVKADARFVYCLGVREDGSVQFSDSLNRRYDYRSGVLDVETNLELPEGFEAGDRNIATRWSAWGAMVPVVPPKHRPRPNADLSKYVLLFEAEEWTWQQPPRPPGDPALLKHVGGDIYAVVATWDLTELERLVLSGRRP
jgi:hypothetical protein